jgi:hypothetical protein
MRTAVLNFDFGFIKRKSFLYFPLEGDSFDGWPVSTLHTTPIRSLGPLNLFGSFVVNLMCMGINLVNK